MTKVFLIYIVLLQRSTCAQLGWCLCVRTCVTLENIVHSISRGRRVTKCWNLVHACNQYQWWYSDLDIPGNSQQSRFSEFAIFSGNLVNLNPELHWFLFSDRFQSLHSFPELCTHSQLKRNISVGYSQRYLWLGCLCSGWESLFYGIAQFKKYDPRAQCGFEYYIMYCIFAPMQKYEFVIFGIFVVQCQKCLCTL